MPKSKKTDLQVLRALLSLPDGKLSGSERTSFQSMYDQMATGRVISLSSRQRAWANEVYDRLDLDRAMPPARPVQVKDRSLIPVVDRMPKPLKPPKPSSR